MAQAFKIAEYLRRHKIHKRWQRVIACTAAVVVFCTTYALILPAITESTTTYCGLSEHTHTDKCYTEEKKLICKKKEVEGHTHSDSCYTQETYLICTEEECEGHSHGEACYEAESILICTNTEEDHEHTDECYEAGMNLVCGREEKTGHSHSDACYRTEDKLSCGLKEAEGHTHDDSCYQVTKKLTCNTPEHSHKKSCYSNPRADVETASVWEKTMKDVELTGDWSQDILLIADSQSGYKESTQNYVTDDNGSKRGYSRYGAWYGDPYGHWCAMFVSFCISYAQIDTDLLPLNSSCQNWITRLNTEKYPYYYAVNDQNDYELINGKNTVSFEEDETDPGLYVPKAGDIIFFNWDREPDSDHVGIIYEVSYKKGVIDSIKTIEGNSSNCVKYNTYEPDDSKIMGFAKLPKNPDYEEEEETETETESETQEVTEAESETETETETETEAVPETAEVMEGILERPEEGESETAVSAKKVKKQVSVVSKEELTEEETKASLFARLGAMLLSADDGITYVTLPNVTVSGSGTTYDPNSDYFTTSLLINFHMPGSSIRQKYFEYTYPQGIVVPASELGEHALYDGQSYAGTYTFVKNSNGTYSVRIAFDDTYINNAGDTVSGFIQFQGMLDASLLDDKGNIRVTGSGFDLNIPASDIVYPADQTKNYDIDVVKSGSYLADSDKLSYTVKIISKKGTKNINYEDVIQASGLTLGNPSVTVVKKTVQNLGQWNETAVSSQQVSYSNYSYQNGHMSMTLPPLSESSQGTEVYYVTYTYDISNYSGTSFSPNNTVTASSRDNTTGESVTDTGNSNVTIRKENSFSKYGQYNSNNGTITWTLNVNSYNNDIAGAVIMDPMFANMTSAGLSGIPSSEYEIIYSNGKAAGIRFKPVSGSTKNTNGYTIYYQTAASNDSWNDKIVSNDATFDGDGNTATRGDQIIGSMDVSVPGGTLSKTFNQAVVSDDSQTAELTWTINMQVPSGGIPAGTKIIEDINRQSYYGSQYLTRDQILRWNGILSWDNGTTISLRNNSNFTAVFQASDGNTYTFDQIRNASGGAGNSLTYTLLNITLNRDLARPSGASNLSFTYYTTADLTTASISGTNYVNHVDVGNKQAYASWNYKPAGVLKTDGNGNRGSFSVKSDGTLIWKVTASMGSDKTASYLEMTDTLPEGVILESISVSDWANANLTLASDGSISGSSYQLVFSGSYDKEAGSVRVRMTNTNGTIQQGTQYTFILNCRIDPDRLSNLTRNPDGSYSFENTASVVIDEGPLGSSSMTQNWTDENAAELTETVSKGAVWDKDNRILNYTVSINPNGEDWVEGSDTLTFNDILTYDGHHWWNNSCYVSLLQGSVKLYEPAVNADGSYQVDARGELVAGREISDWKWSYSTVCNESAWDRKTTNTITGTIPDSTPLVLKYSYQVSMDETSNTLNHTLDISNSINFEGTDKEDTDIRDSDKWESQTTTGGVTTEKHYTFYKVEQNNYNHALDGAVFTLESSADGQNWQSESRTYTTVNGVFSVQWSDGNFESNKLYRVREISAPAGYSMPDPPENYVFYFSSDTNTNNTLPSSIPGGAIDLSVTSYTAYVENVKEGQFTAITVNKKWFDSDGREETDLTGKPDITFDLYRIKSAEGQAEKTRERIGSYSLTNGKGYTKTIDSLLVSETEGDVVYSYTYYVAERGNSDYIVTYENNNTESGISQGTITIKNQTPAKTSVSVRKTWSDGDSVSHDPVQVRLLQNGSPYREAVSLSAGTSPAWYYCFEELPKTDENGRDYSYTVEEIEGPTGYRASVSETSEGYTVTETTQGSVTETGRFFIRLPYTTALESGKTYVFVKKSDNSSALATSGSGLGWTDVGNLTSATSAANAALWTLTAYGDGWIPNNGATGKNLKYETSSSSFVMSSNTDKPVSIIAQADGYYIYSSVISKYYSGTAITSGKDPGASTSEEATVFDVYVYNEDGIYISDAASSQERTYSADQMYILTNTADENAGPGEGGEGEGEGGEGEGVGEGEGGEGEGVGEGEEIAEGDAAAEIEKQWFDDSGEITDERTGSVRFDLYQLATPVSSGSGGGAGTSGSSLEDYLDSLIMVKIVTGHYNAQAQSVFEVPPGTEFSISITSANTPTAKTYSLDDEFASFWNHSTDFAITGSTSPYSISFTVSERMVLEIHTNDNDGIVTIDYQEPQIPSAEPETPTDPEPEEEEDLTDLTEEKLLSMGAVKVGSYTLYDGSDWRKVVKFEKQEGYTYRYFVIENADNYQVGYEGQGTNHIVIQNTITDQTYSLPSTGGAGTVRYRLAGLLLAAGSALVWLFRKKSSMG